MSYIIKGPSDFVPAPEGMFHAVCVDVIDLGVVTTQWGEGPKVVLAWEIEAQMDDGRRFICRKRYTPSLHEKATLYKDLCAWRGRPFTPAELRGFDLEAVLGAPCKLLIQHAERDGTTYANVTAIMKADKDHKMLPSGEYVRVKDRPGSNGQEHPMHTEDGGQHDPEGDIPPF